MNFLAVLSLIAFIAAPLRSGAEEVVGSAPAEARSVTPKELAPTGKLTLVGEVKKRQDMVHFCRYWCGAATPEPRFVLWVPTELRTEYDAIPTEKKSLHGLQSVFAFSLKAAMF